MKLSVDGDTKRDAEGDVKKTSHIAIHSKFYTKSNAEGDTWLHGETT